MIDLPYVLCDPCIALDCENCDGTDETKPFCGHRCKWTETIPDSALDIAE